MSWRTQRIRVAAASGWSPNSCAIRPAQPPIPNCWTARPIAVATISRVRLWAQIGGRQRLAGRRSRPRPVLPVWSGPDDHGWPGSPGPAHAALPILLGRQVIGVGLDKQLFEHRVHAVPPQAGKGPGRAPAAVPTAPLL